MTTCASVDSRNYIHVLRRAYAKHYGERSDVWTGDPAMRCVPALAQAELELPASARALDVGCGTGCDAAYLAARFGTVVGIDMVPHPSWDRMVQEHRPRLTFGATDLLSYESADRYDLVLDNGCFHHQHEHDHIPYLRRAASLLGAGGWFVLSTFKNAAVAEYVDGNGRIHSYFTDDELHEKLDAAGVAVVRERDIPRPGRDDHYRLSFCQARADR